MSVSIGDELAGTFAALGTLVALHHRQNTGRGQVVDASRYESVFAMMEALVPGWEVGGYQRERTGSILPGVAPSNVYPALDGSVLIAGNRDTIFQRLTEVMGQPELAADPRFAIHDARGANSEELDRIISAWSSPQESGHLLDALHEAGVPAGLIYRAKDMLEDPHFKARESIVRLKHDVLGEFPMQGVFPKLSETPGSVRALGPELGEHNADVYRDLLGLSDDEVEALRTDAII